MENVLQGRRNSSDEGIEEGAIGKPGVAELTKQALEQGMDAETILVKGLSRGMEAVGDKYEKGEYFIPDMLAAAEAVGAGMEILEPYFTGSGGRKSKGKVVMSTVESDLHDIGKNLVCIMLKGAGYTVIDLGVDVPAQRIVEVVEKEQAQVVGLSALLSTTMNYMEKTIEELKKRNMKGSVKVIVGGAPTSADFARDIGADAYGSDAFAAIREIDRLLKTGGDSSSGS